jgi:dimethylglycine dehydrogenase
VGVQANLVEGGRSASDDNDGLRVGKSLAPAMVGPEHAAIGTELEMTVLGARHGSRSSPKAPMTQNRRLRA